MFRAILAVSAALVVSAPAVAATATQECPRQEGKSTEQLLEAAPSCDASMKLFEACAVGASGDVQLGSVVQEKCEADFLPRLKKPQRAAYNAAIRRCDRKYRNENGSMYRSFEAFCRAEAAQKYSRQEKKQAKKTGARR